MDLSNVVGQIGGENVKKIDPPGKKRKTILLLALLCLLCVGVSELVASYFFDRPLFDALTAPARRAAAAVADWGGQAASSVADWGSAVAHRGRQTAEAVSLWGEEVTAPAEPSLPPDGQRADGPAVVRRTEAADPAVTRLKPVGEQLYLTGGVCDIHYFEQGEEPWASMPFGTDKIGPYGCGPTAMAMAVSSLTDHSTDPGRMAQWAYEEGYWAKQSGSYLSLVEGAARAYGLYAYAMEAHTPEAVRAALLSGDLLVALMGPGHFTKSGHFILLRGMTLNGTVLVADPASRERSLAQWEPQLILDELSKSTAHGAPLWVLSRRPKSP